MRVHPVARQGAVCELTFTSHIAACRVICPADQLFALPVLEITSLPLGAHAGGVGRPPTQRYAVATSSRSIAAAASGSPTA